MLLDANAMRSLLKTGRISLKTGNHIKTKLLYLHKHNSFALCSESRHFGSFTTTGTTFVWEKRDVSTSQVTTITVMIITRGRNWRHMPQMFCNWSSPSVVKQNPGTWLVYIFTSREERFRSLPPTTKLASASAGMMSPSYGRIGE